MAGFSGSRALVEACLATLLAGCATVPSGGALQSIAIELVSPKGGRFAGTALCTLSDGTSEWTANAPGRTMVTTGAGPLRVKCRSEDGRASGELLVEAQVRGGRVRSTLIGAGVGLLVGGAAGAVAVRNEPSKMDRGLLTLAGGVVGGLYGTVVGGIAAKSAYEYPAQARVPMQADAPPR